MDRVFTRERQEQGFKSQEHLDAFYASYDHAKSCSVCSGVAGAVWLSDGPQPYLGSCDEGERLREAIHGVQEARDAE